MKSALLVRLGGLGDLLAVLPSLRLLREGTSGFRLTLVCREEYGTIFLETGVVDELEPESRPRFSRLYSESGSIPEDAASWLGGFDLVLGWMQSRGGGDLENVLERSGKPYRLLVYDAKSDVPVGRYFFEATARFLGPSVSIQASFDKCFFLPLTDAHTSGGRRLAEKKGIGPGSRYAVIHPGAGSAKKRWPFKKYLEMAIRLSGEGLAGLFVTGEAETDLEADLEKTALPSSWSHVPRPNVMDLAGLLARSTLYLGNDSGITHLAAACGARVLAVFRKETEAAWRPGGHSIVLSADDTASVPFDDVSAAARRILIGT